MPLTLEVPRQSSTASSGNTHEVESNISIKPENISVAKRTRSLPKDDDILGLYSPADVNDRRRSTSPSLNSQSEKPSCLPSMNSQRMSLNSLSSMNSQRSHTRTNNINAYAAKRTRSPFFSSQMGDFVEMEMQNRNTGSVGRHDVSPSKVFSQKKLPVIATAKTDSPPLSTNLNTPKRARSPPSQSADVLSTSSSSQLDSGREMQAKAKRLARFNVELRQPLQTPEEPAKKKLLGNKHDQTIFGEPKKAHHSPDEALDNAGRDVLSDNEGSKLSKVVIGQCADMCPEPERDERERKGDLDKFERLNGERNQTTKLLAVKKYNRTAEREAYLIRPLPVLRTTVDYLLNLLDQPYNENFLGIYNFLWDRMRAVRMDLRMQHIFNQEAILMLEQMIRLHIVAMHELCEYKKGEGFTEGFDAHLNIEQMNKTSVELFQMYDDHKKKGMSVSTEKEFRGYYALLKLDKHPGYKVEPSELSLDLAKMSPEMRCTPEILYARTVARACRIGNFIAFFRLARKATYLQACLMHAHFAKLRTQALASLHSGLQNNQGIPISQIVDWLGLEEEDIESLLEYHGFSLRNYEEPYMVKEGPFFNSDSDFPTTRSQLVHLKKSESIVQDVKYGPSISEFNIERKTKSAVNIADVKTKTSKRERWVSRVDEETMESKVDSPRVIFQPQRMLEKPLQNTWNNREENHESIDVSLAIPNREREMVEGSPIEVDCLSGDDSVIDHEQNVGYIKIFNDTSVNMSSTIEAGLSASSGSDSITGTEIQENEVDQNVEKEVSMILAQQKEEAFREKLKFILRKWKERSSVLREIREEKEFLANVALSSLSLGPPIRRQSGVQASYITEDLNLDQVARERFNKLEKSWARLNVAELTAPILSSRNPDAQCIVWKLLFIVQANGRDSQTYNMAFKWLHSKIMASDTGPDDELIVSSPRVSIWMQVSPSHSCCLSILRETSLSEDDDYISGSSGLLFLASGNISWDAQRVQIQKLISLIPYGASLPLLILITDTIEEKVAIMGRLGLHEADTRKISSLSVISLCTNTFFDDDKLKEGLQWLASNSPLQPILHFVDTHELILSNLRHAISILENMNLSEIHPNHCISSFNDALNHSAEEIIAAASTNPNDWPVPEIYMVEELNFELPSIGWSSNEKIDPIVRAIRGCRLPSFSNGMSWLNQSSPQNQMLAIEDSLIKYLTQSQLLNFELAVKEASMMLQKNASLELRGSCHYIVPRWVNIFRRIFNWQLMKLKGNELSEAYILANKSENMPEECVSSYHAQNDLSLDEMMEISCNIPFMEQPKSAFQHICTSREIIFETISEVEKEDVDVRENEFSHHVSHNVRENEFSLDVRYRLDMLLEQCKKRQDSIESKLKIYGCNTR